MDINTEDVPHLYGPRILLPTVEQFSWVAAKGVATHTKNLLQRLGDRTDDADMHVATP